METGYAGGNFRQTFAQAGQTRGSLSCWKRQDYKVIIMRKAILGKFSGDGRSLQEFPSRTSGQKSSAAVILDGFDNEAGLVLKCPTPAPGGGIARRPGLRNWYTLLVKPLANLNQIFFSHPLVTIRSDDASYLGVVFEIRFWPAFSNHRLLCLDRAFARCARAPLPSPLRFQILACCGPTSLFGAGGPPLARRAMENSCCSRSRSSSSAVSGDRQAARTIACLSGATGWAE
jgi:hypothetical protein